ncbi:MAG: hypothetical protein KDD34_00050 [Bdellovibrionales bacterium]|nr:hypothetical protein [Bdellovibrionales bacterium]
MNTVKFIVFIFGFLLMPIVGYASGCDWRDVEYVKNGTPLKTIVVAGHFECWDISRNHETWLCRFKIEKSSEVFELPSYAFIKKSDLPPQNINIQLPTDVFAATEYFPSCNSGGSTGTLFTFNFNGQDYRYFKAGLLRTWV